MHKDIPLATIIITDSELYFAERIACAGKYFPFEMQEVCSGDTLRTFCEQRCTPKTRQGLSAELSKAGYDRYSHAAILIQSNGRDCSDPYWIRFKDGPQTWREVWAEIGVVRS